MTWFNISYVYSETVAEEGDGESEQSQTKEGKDGKFDIVYLSGLVANSIAKLTNSFGSVFDVQSC